MRPNERRELLLESLLQRREDTIENLASEFGVNERTIRRDIEQLTSSYQEIDGILRNGYFSN